MRHTHSLPAPEIDFELRRPRARLRVSALARLRGPALDSQFARGVETWRSSTHAARALQLTSDRSRSSLARALERLLKEAARPAALRRGGPVPICRSQVLEAESALRAIADRLRSRAPVDAHGIAGLLELLRDGCGPIYVRVPPGVLIARLQSLLAHLDAVT